MLQQVEYGHTHTDQHDGLINLLCLYIRKESGLTMLKIPDSKMSNVYLFLCLSAFQRSRIGGQRVSKSIQILESEAT